MRATCLEAALVALLALSAGAHAAGRAGPKRMLHQKRALDILHEHDRRQGAGGLLPISIPEVSAPPANTPASSVTSPGVSSSPPVSAPPPPSSSPPAAAPPPTTISSAPLTTPSTPSSTVPSSTRPSSVAPSSISQGNSVVNVFRTSTISGPPASSASAAAAQQSAPADTGSSGLGKGTIIAVIVVASSCAGVFLIWTIFRRWKLKPSRTLDDRLQPIAFGPDEKGGFAPVPSTLSRNDSTGSRDSDRPLQRRDSFGSAMGSQRGAGSQRGGAMSESGSRSNFGGSNFGGPSYPPRSDWTSFAPPPPPSNQMPHSSPSLPRLANPYGSDYGATHGIVRSDTLASAGRYGGEGYRY